MTEVWRGKRFSRDHGLSPGRPAASPPGMADRCAVVFADIVGYSILTAADEIGTHDRWLAFYRDVVLPEAAAHGGRVFSPQGDGVLAAFPNTRAALTWSRALHGAAARTQADGIYALPMVFRIAMHAGPVLWRDEGLFGDTVIQAARLQEYAEPGGIVLSAEVLAEVAPLLHRPTRDLGALPLRGIPRPVRAFALSSEHGTPAVPLLPPPPRLPSIAVLPLANASGDPDDAYLGDGLVEDIIASLAGLHEVFVIAAESARMFRGTQPNPLRVGRVLGVRFVVTGTLRRAGTVYRVAFQLADTADGRTLWADHFTLRADEVFDMQDEVVARIAAGISPQIRAVSLQDAMRKRPESLTAYELMLRGLHLFGAQEREAFFRARDYLSQAVKEDPSFALPLAWLARWHSVSIGHGWSPDPRADLTTAMALADQASALDGANVLALATFGHLVAYLRHDAETALDCFARALVVGPNNAVAWCLSSLPLAYVGRGEEAVRHAERGTRLSPYDPMRFSHHHFLAIAQYAAGNLSAAERQQRLSIAANPSHASSWRVMAAVLAALGRDGEARDAAARMLQLQPGFRLDHYVREAMPMRDAALRARFARDLQAAGLPV